jgi:hypothetical protein
MKDNNTQPKTRKLALKKDTIRSLTETQLEQVNGGMLSSYPGCKCSSSIYEEIYINTRPCLAR